ncbi:MAG: GspE/PulE family protein [Dehalococcoidales bacterium]|nr:GspE/PulE family protein [Dehalococcoidales bacterium]
MQEAEVIKIFNLNTHTIQPEVLQLIPESAARKHNVIPLAILDNSLQVATAEADNVPALQELAVLSKMRISPVPADIKEIQNAIDHNYKSYHEIENQFDIISSVAKTEDGISFADIANAPAVRALDLIISEAVKVRTSDIHIEPQEKRLRVRFRIDGVLSDMMSLHLSAHAPILSRLKIMAKMNIADRSPQDGQFSIKVRSQEIDVRVATADTIYGEMGSLRLLYKSFAARSLSQLGFLPENLKQYENILKSPYGMLLVCGPTGSGKTTTLYASINCLDSKSRKVITIEDPVEYRFKDICQMQVNKRAGLTFASGLRSIMRHDPNVIMVGEIRDAETVRIATQSALTGQLVLSSIHANDTIGCLFRLQDLGIGLFLISAVVIGIVSQRMVRCVCPHCSHLVEAPLEAQIAYRQETGEERTHFLYGKGCNACANTGYLGRVPIIEILVMNKEIRSTLLSGANADEVRSTARKLGMKSMWHDGMLKVKEGITTPTEVLFNVLHE